MLPTLEAIKEQGLLKPAEVDGMREAYLFLRKLENLLQAAEDKQTQTLPDIPEKQASLAKVMGFADYSELLEALHAHTSHVHQVFDDLIGGEDEQEQGIEPVFIESWTVAADKQALETIFDEGQERLKEKSATELAEVLHRFKGELGKKTLGPRGREVINH